MLLQKIHASIAGLGHIVIMLHHPVFYAKKVTIALAHYKVMKALLTKDIYEVKEVELFVPLEHII